MTESDRNSLDRRLASLPREIVPPRSLWPDIAARIDRVPRGTHPYLMAACVATLAACLASVFTWAVLRHAWTPAGLSLVAENQAEFGELGDPRYVLARDDLQKTFRERLALLEPKTRAQIEASLLVIRDAHEKIRGALLADPASPALEELYQSTWHDEIDLYERVVRSTEPSLTRT